MNGFPDRVVPTKAKGDITDTARDLRSRQMRANPAGGFNKVDRITIVFFDTGRNRKHIWIKDNVLGCKPRLIHQESVGAFTNRATPLEGVGLALFIEGHHDHRGAVFSTEAGLTQELRFALFHRNGIDDAAALHTFQTGLDHLPF